MTAPVTFLPVAAHLDERAEEKQREARWLNAMHADLSAGLLRWEETPWAETVASLPVAPEHKQDIATGNARRALEAVCGELAALQGQRGGVW